MDDYEMSCYKKTTRKFVKIKDGVTYESTMQEQEEDFNKYGIIALSWYTWEVTTIQEVKQ